MRRLQTLVPMDFVFRTALLAIVIVTIVWLVVSGPDSFGDPGSQRTLLGIGLVSLTVSGLDLFLRRGYSISFDEETIFWRKVGFHRDRDVLALPIGQISEVYSEPGSLGIKPFEAIILNDALGNKIILSRMYLRDDEIRELLGVIQLNSNASFRQEVQEFARNE